MKSPDFDPDNEDTWFLASPATCPHEDLSDTAADGGRHYFRWDPEHPLDAYQRNIWNPLDPRCIRCGATIGELVLAKARRVET